MGRPLDHLYALDRGRGHLGADGLTGNCYCADGLVGWVADLIGLVNSARRGSLLYRLYLL